MAGLGRWRRRTCHWHVRVERPGDTRQASTTHEFFVSRHLRRTERKHLHGWPGHVWMAPRLARVFLRFGAQITCGHVSGLFARRKAAGPDGIRGSRSDQAHGVAMPLGPAKVSLDPSIDRRCHHASSPSQAFQSEPALALKPPLAWPGSPLVASSPPRRCAPSCWPRRRPPPCAPWLPAV